MIADSPYDFSGLLLKPLVGVVIGLIGAGLMLGVLAILEPLTGLSPAYLLSQVTQVLLPNKFVASCAACDPSIGLVGHLLLGLIFGLLYALCLQSIPIRGLVGIGIFYGFVIWIVGSLLIGLLIGESVRVVLRSWPWLVAHLVFGIFLAISAIWAQRIKSRGPDVVVPID